MVLLEEIKPGVLVKGLLPGNLVTVIDVKRQGSICVELTYKDANGHFDSVCSTVRVNRVLRSPPKVCPGASMQTALLFDSLQKLTDQSGVPFRSTDCCAYIAYRASTTPDHRCLRNHARQTTSALPAGR